MSIPFAQKLEIFFVHPSQPKPAWVHRLIFPNYNAEQACESSCLPLAHDHAAQLLPCRLDALQRAARKVNARQRCLEEVHTAEVAILRGEILQSSFAQTCPRQAAALQTGLFPPRGAKVAVLHAAILKTYVVQTCAVKVRPEHAAIGKHAARPYPIRAICTRQLTSGQLDVGKAASFQIRTGQAALFEHAAVKGHLFQICVRQVQSF